jgi:hypothetical protein
MFRGALIEGVVHPSREGRICWLRHIHVAGGFYKLVVRITGTEPSHLRQAPAYVLCAVPGWGSAGVGWGFGVAAAQRCKSCRFPEAAPTGNELLRELRLPLPEGAQRDGLQQQRFCP